MRRSHTGLGILYLKMDEVAAARRHLDSAFAMCRVVHGGTVNRETATALHNLGCEMGAWVHRRIEVVVC